MPASLRPHRRGWVVSHLEGDQRATIDNTIATGVFALVRRFYDRRSSVKTVVEIILLREFDLANRLFVYHDFNSRFCLRVDSPIGLEGYHITDVDLSFVVC